MRCRGLSDPGGRGEKAFFPMGYAVGSVHFVRNYCGNTKTDFYEFRS